MLKIKKQYLLPFVLFGILGFLLLSLPLEAAVTKTTTVEYEFSAPGQEKNEVNSNTSTRRSCSSSNNDDDDGGSSSGGIDVDGDGNADYKNSYDAVNDGYGYDEQEDTRSPCSAINPNC